MKDTYGIFSYHKMSKKDIERSKERMRMIETPDEAARHFGEQVEFLMWHWPDHWETRKRKIDGKLISAMEDNRVKDVKLTEE